MKSQNSTSQPSMIETQILLQNFSVLKLKFHFKIILEENSDSTAIGMQMYLEL